jgi:hypothetical protein
VNFPTDALFRIFILIFVTQTAKVHLLCKAGYLIPYVDSLMEVQLCISVIESSTDTCIPEIC